MPLLLSPCNRCWRAVAVPSLEVSAPSRAACLPFLIKGVGSRCSLAATLEPGGTVAPTAPAAADADGSAAELWAAVQWLDTLDPAALSAMAAANIGGNPPPHDGTPGQPSA